MPGDFSALVRAIERRLRDPLPGVEGQLPLSPRPRSGWRPDVFPPGCRDAAALIALYLRGGRPHTVLTLRRHDLSQHGGQVSLPGGVVEEGENHAEAAVREAEEEIGLTPADVRLLGSLSPLHIPVSRFILFPQVGVIRGSPRFTPSDAEVQRILEVPLDALTDPANRGELRREKDGKTFDVPYLALDGEKVWGATAMVLAEWIALLEELA